MRSGQPLTGTNGKRCREDEKLLNAPLRAGKRGYVIDTRPLNVAQQARAKGGGFEQEAHYPQWRRIHKAIERYTSLPPQFSSLVSPRTHSLSPRWSQPILQFGQSGWGHPSHLWWHEVIFGLPPWMGPKSLAPP